MKTKIEEVNRWIIDNFMIIVILTIFILFVLGMFVLPEIDSQLTGSVSEDISDFGYNENGDYYVYIQDNDSDTDELYNFPIQDTQVFYLKDETAQSYITYDVDRRGRVHNVKIYSTEKIK